MTNQKGFLAGIISKLEKADIPYMLSGSMGSSFYGHPRATNDADIVIDPVQNSLTYFLNSLEPETYYASREAALQALKNRSMFNVIHVKYGWKADLIIRKEREYSRKEFSRRKKLNIMNVDVYVLSAEDSVLSKLEWTKDRESQVQINDVIGILTVQWDKLDFGYLRDWADKLEVGDLFEQLIQKIKEEKRS